MPVTGDKGNTQEPTPSGTEKKPTGQEGKAALTKADVEVVAEKVYRLMRRDLLQERERVV